LPKNPDSYSLENDPVITAGKPNNQDNSLLIARAEPKLAITNYRSKAEIRQIPPKNQAKFSLNSLAIKQFRYYISAYALSSLITPTIKFKSLNNFLATPANQSNP
jgi:hypothetical protein